MIADLQARFLPRFLATSQERLARARMLVDAGDARTLAAELHALAGEAMMLDLAKVAENAREGESAARVWSSGPTDGSRDFREICASCLVKVSEAVAKLSKEGAP